MRSISIFICLLLFTSSFVWAAEEKADYQAYSKSIREWVWGMDLPQFNNYKLPKEYTKESSVVLARYTEITTASTASFSGMGVLTLLGGFHVNRGVNLSKLMRQTVYLNDKAAVDEYSEYDFRSYSFNAMGHKSLNVKRVLGAKVIKKSGEVKVVDIDEAASMDVSDDKVTRIAIPGLSVGDVLDLFAFEFVEHTNVSIDPIVIYFGNEEPVLNTQVHCVFDKDLNVRYRHFNGAPHMTRSVDDKGNYTLDLKTSIQGKKMPERYYIAAAQVPYIRIDLTRLKSNRGIAGQIVPKYALKEGIFEDPDPTDIVRYYLDMVDSYYWRVPHNVGLSPKPRGIIEELIKRDPNMSDTQKADIFYKVLAMCYGANNIKVGEQKEYDMLTSLVFWLRDYKIKYQVGVTTTRFKPSIDNILDHRDISFIIHVEDGDGYFVAPYEGVYQNGSYLPAAYQGRKAYFAPYEERTGVVDGDKYQLVTLPVSTVDDNKLSSELKVTIDDRALRIVRKTSATGHAKLQDQEAMISHFQLDSAYRSQLPTTQTYSDRYPTKTLYRMQIEYYKRYIPQLQKSVLKGYHGVGVSNVDYVKIDNVGIDAENPAFVNEASYTLEKMVFDSGDSKVLSVGRLIDPKQPISEEEEEREVDIYFACPISRCHSIDIELPQGYELSPSSLKALHMSVANNIGEFTSKATIEGSHLKIEVKNQFSQHHAPVSDWQKLKDILKAHQAFRELNIVIRKR
ncbi:MAG: DUF3857 domain-containing protein [Bacteroidia bacterium]|nr:DUF3857 domain-containing protein [Bacteroidia bacterium]